MARNDQKHKSHKTKPIHVEAPTDSPIGPNIEETAPSDSVLKAHKPSKRNVRAMRSEE